MESNKVDASGVTSYPGTAQIIVAGTVLEWLLTNVSADKSLFVSDTGVTGVDGVNEQLLLPGQTLAFPAMAGSLWVRVQSSGGSGHILYWRAFRHR